MRLDDNDDDACEPTAEEEEDGIARLRSESDTVVVLGFFSHA